jgi:hypothetical protein
MHFFLRTEQLECCCSDLVQQDYEADEDHPVAQGKSGGLVVMGRHVLALKLFGLDDAEGEDVRNLDQGSSTSGSAAIAAPFSTTSSTAGIPPVATNTEAPPRRKPKP